MRMKASDQVLLATADYEASAGEYCLRLAEIIGFRGRRLVRKNRQWFYANESQFLQNREMDAKRDYWHRMAPAFWKGGHAFH